MAPLLRDVIDTDLPIFFEQQNDEEANRLAAFPARERGPFFTHWQKILADESGRKQTIVYAGQVAGYIVGFNRGGEREIGYWLGREFWGQGIASAALAAFLQIESTRPLTAFAAAHNLGSIRVLEKNGFRKVGAFLDIETLDGQPAEGVICRLD